MFSFIKKAFQPYYQLLLGHRVQRQQEQFGILFTATTHINFWGRGEKDRELLYSKANSESNFGCSSWKGRREKDQAVPWFYLAGYQSKSCMLSRRALNNDYLQTSIKWKKNTTQLQESGLHLSVVIQLRPAKKLSSTHTSLLSSFTP